MGGATVGLLLDMPHEHAAKVVTLGIGLLCAGCYNMQQQHSNFTTPKYTWKLLVIGPLLYFGGNLGGTFTQSSRWSNHQPFVGAQSAQHRPLRHRCPSSVSTITNRSTSTVHCSTRRPLATVAPTADTAHYSFDTSVAVACTIDGVG